MTENKNIQRRTVLKGAAWSVPVVAAAVATPFAAASNDKARLAINAGCIQIAGVGLLPAFSVSNSGTDDYTDSITIVETIDLSSISLSAVRSVLWTVLVTQTVAGLLEGHDAGVTVGSWQGSDGDAWVSLGVFSSSYKKATRTITIPAGVAAGAHKSWGQLISINLSQLFGGSWMASITDPTGNPPVTKGSDTLPMQLLGGCN